jgi:hypothetical protein
VRDIVQGKEASQGTGVMLEAARCDWNAGNAEFHGAEHLGTIQCHLPKYLTENPLPLSTAAVKQDMRENYGKKWRRKWEGSPRYPKLNKIDPLMLSNKYSRITVGLWRKQAGIITQIQTGHVPLNKYLD